MPEAAGGAAGVGAVGAADIAVSVDFFNIDQTVNKVESRMQHEYFLGLLLRPKMSEGEFSDENHALTMIRC